MRGGERGIDQQILQRVVESFRLDQPHPSIRPHAPTIASQGLTTTPGTAIDRPGAVAQFADERVVDAGKAGFLRLVQLEIPAEALETCASVR